MPQHAQAHYKPSAVEKRSFFDCKSTPRSEKESNFKQTKKA
jgi:hypothetical protein